MASPTADTFTASNGVLLRGGRGTPPVPGALSWVPTTAWQWTDIPSSTWSSYMKSDGSGVAPAITASDPGSDRTYLGQWAFQGPCYSRKNHEVYLFGGGHSNSTNNAASRWNLNTNTPNVSLVCAPTTEAIRNNHLELELWLTTAYHTDGKPTSPHTYYNNVYSDATDELISFGLAATSTGYPTASGGSSGSWDVAALQRSGVWRPENYYTDVQTTYNNFNRGPRLMSEDGLSVYYWDAPDASPSVLLRKWVIGTGADKHTVVGSSVIPFYSCQADSGTGIALVMGGAGSVSGWQAKFVTLATGATVNVTVSGDSIPAGLFCQDITWCGTRGYYVALWVNQSATLGGGAVTSSLVATITPTSANTAIASIKTMTGAAVGTVPVFRGVFYDPLFDAVIVVPGPDVPLKIFKVA